MEQQNFLWGQMNSIQRKSVRGFSDPGTMNKAIHDCTNSY